MHYGLVNVASVFQAFINKVLQDFLHSCMIIYIDKRGGWVSDADGGLNQQATSDDSHPWDRVV